MLQIREIHQPPRNDIAAPKPPKAHYMKQRATEHPGAQQALEDRVRTDMILPHEIAILRLLGDNFLEPTEAFAGCIAYDASNQKLDSRLHR
jgi:hypothetical protein